MPGILYLSSRCQGGLVAVMKQRDWGDVALVTEHDSLERASFSASTCDAGAGAGVASLLHDDVGGDGPIQAAAFRRGWAGDGCCFQRTPGSGQVPASEALRPPSGPSRGGTKASGRNSVVHCGSLPEARSCRRRPGETLRGRPVTGHDPRTWVGQASDRATKGDRVSAVAATGREVPEQSTPVRPGGQTVHASRSAAATTPTLPASQPAQPLPRFTGGSEGDRVRRVSPSVGCDRVGGGRLKALWQQGVRDDAMPSLGRSVPCQSLDEVESVSGAWPVSGQGFGTAGADDRAKDESGDNSVVGVTEDGDDVGDQVNG